MARPSALLAAQMPFAMMISNPFVLREREALKSAVATGQDTLTLSWWVGA